MQVQMDEELKQKAVKTKPIKFEGAAEDKTPRCYFSPDHKISETQAKITRIKFGYPICLECLVKVGQIVVYVVEVNFK